jgi:hypothetical protein
MFARSTIDSPRCPSAALRGPAKPDLSIISALFGLALAACGGGRATPKDAHTADAFAGPDAELAKWIGMVEDFETAGGIGSAMVCVVGQSDVPCVETAPTGSFALGVPLSATTENIAVGVSVDGYLDGIVLGETGSGSAQVTPPTLVLMSNAVETNVLGSDAGFTTSQSTSGYLEVQLTGTNLTGATATLTPASGTTVYGDASSIPNKALTSTSASGTIFFGNVTPGTVAVTVKLTGKTCTATGSGSALLPGDWASTTATAAAQVVPAALTDGVEVTCN